MPHRISGSIYLFITFVPKDRKWEPCPLLPAISKWQFHIAIPVTQCPMHYKPHTQSTESSSECNSLFHSAQIFCYSKQKLSRTYTWDKRPKILKFTWTTPHFSGNSPWGGQSLKGRALTAGAKLGRWRRRSSLTRMMKLLWCQIRPHGQCLLLQAAHWWPYCHLRYE